MSISVLYFVNCIFIMKEQSTRDSQYICARGKKQDLLPFLDLRLKLTKQLRYTRYTPHELRELTTRDDW